MRVGLCWRMDIVRGYGFPEEEDLPWQNDWRQSRCLRHY
jgi:hypothetical protein